MHGSIISIKIDLLYIQPKIPTDPEEDSLHPKSYITTKNKSNISVLFHKKLICKKTSRRIKKNSILLHEKAEEKAFMV